MARVSAEPEDNVLVAIFKSVCSCFLDESSMWKFERAPEPSDINWQNLGVGLCRRICQTSGVYIFTTATPLRPFKKCAFSMLLLMRNFLFFPRKTGTIFEGLKQPWWTWHCLPCPLQFSYLDQRPPFIVLLNENYTVAVNHF